MLDGQTVLENIMV